MPVHPTTAALAARRPRGLHPFWARLLVGWVLVSVTPGATEALEEVVSLATGVDCAHACDDVGGDCCPETCSHCACCAHPNAVPSTPLCMPGGPAIESASLRPYLDAGVASGYRAPPYRPPAV